MVSSPSSPFSQPPLEVGKAESDVCRGARSSSPFICHPCPHFPPAQNWPPSQLPQRGQWFSSSYSQPPQERSCICGQLRLPWGKCKDAPLSSQSTCSTSILQAVGHNPKGERGVVATFRSQPLAGTTLAQASHLGCTISHVRKGGRDWAPICRWYSLVKAESLLESCTSQRLGSSSCAATPRAGPDQGATSQGCCEDARGRGNREGGGAGARAEWDQQWGCSLVP